ncbi:MAG: rhomboid family intramembrane serine protease [Muribaculaceae bacterium]|nr:rhomboid family intramembrane serine protease [Muribaculaceae bacterium]
MGLVDRLRNYCGGSRALAMLLLIIAGSGAGCMGWLLICWIAGWNPGIINPWLALSSDPVTALTHFWTFASYMVLHFSPLHLIFNLLWLYWFGLMLTDIRKDSTLLTLFVGGGVTGGIIYVVVASLAGKSGTSFLTGDSCAVLSVMTATGILMPDRRLNLFLIGEVKIKWIALACVILSLLGGSGGAAQGAHVGGVIWGFGASLYFKGYFGSLFRRAHANEGIGTYSRTPRHNPRNTARAMQRLSDHERLDQLLDKIRISGYDSLSAREKTELDHISARIDKN